MCNRSQCYSKIYRTTKSSFREHFIEALQFKQMVAFSVSKFNTQVSRAIIGNWELAMKI